MVITFAELLKLALIALLPAIVAIVLALITKEVYSSLFVGIVVGGIIYTCGDAFPFIHPVQISAILFFRSRYI